MQIKATINGDPFGTGLTNCTNKKITKFKRVLKTSADDIKKDVASKAPAGSTGKLKRSFATQQENSGLTQIIGSKLFYLHFASDDTKAHTIKPTKKKFLAWGGYVGKYEFQTLKGKNKGNWTAKRVYRDSQGRLTLNRKEANNQNFARQVHNPGHRGNRFFEDALTENRAEVLNALYRVLKEGD